MDVSRNIGQSNNNRYFYKDTLAQIKSAETQEKELALKKQEICQGLERSIDEGSEAVSQLIDKSDTLTFERKPLKEKMQTENKKSCFSFFNCFNCFK